MTQHKALKQRVRARMTKTGERYTAARAQVLRGGGRDDHDPVPGIAPVSRGDAGDVARGDAGDVAPEASGDAAAAVDGALAVADGPVPDSPFRGGYGASDEALITRTGHDWSHWYRVLDAWGGKDRPHVEIARFLNLDLGVEGWWSQELTVRYEMAIGRRVPNQRVDGFEATAARTIKAAPERVYAAVVDEAERAIWLDRPVHLRKANQNRTKSAFATVRFDWEVEGERVVIWMADKGDRTAVSLAHQRLPDRDSADRMKAFWRERLGALAVHVEATGYAPDSSL